MSIYTEKARELGRLILESEESLRLADAAAAYENCPEAVEMMEGYKARQRRLAEGVRAGDLSQEEVREESQALAQQAAALKQDPVVGALVFVENEFNQLVNQVVYILRATVTGNGDAGDCAGGCGGCGSRRGCGRGEF